ATQVGAQTDRKRSSWLSFIEVHGELWSGKIAINGKNGRVIIEDAILGPTRIGDSEHYVVDELEPEIGAAYHGSWIGN
ncbi:hypothetical protein E4U52_000555, partial [Claviceps spartinae]